MKPELLIGRILKPRGLKGELKVQFNSQDSERYAGLKYVIIDGRDCQVNHLSVSGEFGYILLNGTDTVEKAEILRNKEISVRREDLPPLSDGSYYIDDIIGMNVCAGENMIGYIYDVLQYGAADVYCVKSGEKTLSFPALKKLIKEVNISENLMVLDEAVYQQVVCLDNEN